MNIFGIGPLELVLILLLALIVFGPKDLQKTARMLGSTLNKIVHSDFWQLFNKTRREFNNLPQRLMREAGADELQRTTGQALTAVKKDLEKAVGTLDPVSDLRPPATPPAPPVPSPQSEEKTGE